MSQHTAVLLNKLNKYETSHGWHFIASILTGGIWIIMWILFAISNAIERGKNRFALHRYGIGRLRRIEHLLQQAQGRFHTDLKRLCHAANAFVDEAGHAARLPRHRGTKTQTIPDRLMDALDDTADTARRLGSQTRRATHVGGA